MIRGAKQRLGKRKTEIGSRQQEATEQTEGRWARESRFGFPYSGFANKFFSSLYIGVTKGVIRSQARNG